MKHETITADIFTTLAAATAAIARKATLAKLPQAVESGSSSATIAAAVDAAMDARSSDIAAAAAVARIPAPRRQGAADTIKRAEALALDIARSCGGSYSGATDCRVKWGVVATAETRTSKGGQYSNACIYKKLDALHEITLARAGVHELVQNQGLREASARDGLPLIALYPDGAAVWVESKGKTIISKSGWLVGDATECFHSAKSMEHARAGLAKKRAIAKLEADKAKTDKKQERRARLVARLCAGVTATLADARALGFCSPGIQAFQSRHGIGETATLPQLVRTGDASAIRLALAMARKVVAA